MDDEAMPLTALDKIAGGEQLQMIKAMLPYLGGQNQKFFAIFIKILEIQNILSFFSHSKDIGGCHAASKEGSAMEDMLNDLKIYGSRSQRENIEQALNMIQIMNLMNAFSASGSSPEDMMGAFLSPEQQAMFSAYQTMFSSESETESGSESKPDAGEKQE